MTIAVDLGRKATKQTLLRRSGERFGSFRSSSYKLNSKV